MGDDNEAIRSAQGDEREAVSRTGGTYEGCQPSAPSDARGLEAVVPCYKPFTAWRPLEGGAILFKESKNCREVKIPCKMCIGCRIERQEMWAVRCFAESKMHERNCFITLTYDDENLPTGGSLSYRDFQLFMKRLRRRNAGTPIRFFMAGEYGEALSRPHYHALLFGFDFDDAVPVSSMRSVGGLKQSAELQECWGHGMCSVGEVTYASARYCAAYVLKKHRVTGEDDDHYKRIDERTGEIVEVLPEFAQMSLKPGIGAAWLEKYWKDIYTTGANAMILNGQRKPVPSYFHQLMEGWDPMFMESYNWDRERRALEKWEDNTPERLKVREECHTAQVNFNKQRYL